MTQPTNPQPTPHTDQQYQTKPFSLAIDAVKQLFNTNASATTFVLLASLVLSIINQGSLSLNSSTSSANLLGLGVFGISLFFGLVGIGISLSTISGKKISVSESVNWGLEHFLVYIGYIIVLTAIVAGGAILLVIPGIVFAIWFGLTPIIKLDQGGTLKENLARSRALIKGRVIEYIAVNIASIVVSVFGLLGPAAQNAPIVAWYKQKSAAQRSGKELPPTATSSTMTVVIGVMLGAVLSAVFIVLALRSVQ
jgi:hypothetical protein